MDVHLIGDHPHVIIAPTAHRLARKSRIPLSDLASETFLTREPGSGTRGLMEQLFESAGIRPKIGLAMSSNETIKQAVITGLGIAFISAHTVAIELDERRPARRYYQVTAEGDAALTDAGLRYRFPEVSPV